MGEALRQNHIGNDSWRIFCEEIIRLRFLFQLAFWWWGISAVICSLSLCSMPPATVAYPSPAVPATPPGTAAPYTRFLQPRSVHVCSHPCTKRICYLNLGLLFHFLYHSCGPGLWGLCKRAVQNQPVPTVYRELDVSAPWHRRWSCGKNTILLKLLFLLKHILPY